MSHRIPTSRGMPHGTPWPDPSRYQRQRPERFPTSVSVRPVLTVAESVR